MTWAIHFLYSESLFIKPYRLKFSGFCWISISHIIFVWLILNLYNNQLKAYSVCLMWTFNNYFITYQTLIYAYISKNTYLLWTNFLRFQNKYGVNQILRNFTLLSQSETTIIKHKYPELVTKYLIGRWRSMSIFVTTTLARWSIVQSCASARVYARVYRDTHFHNGLNFFNGNFISLCHILPIRRQWTVGLTPQGEKSPQCITVLKSNPIMYPL